MTEPFLKVEEVLEEGPVPLYRQPIWKGRFPWLLQGNTGRGSGEPFDLGSFGSAPVGEVLARWNALREAAGFRTVVHSHQVHRTDLQRWEDDLPDGIFFVHGKDGHISKSAGLLMAVSVADCVPVSIISADSRYLSAVHSGWRGVAAGAMEGAVDELSALGGTVENLWVHFGPSICGSCYEVGPEVHAGVNPHLPVPNTPTPIDLRRALAQRAAARGIPASQITISAHCTQCGPGSFFSHRGGNRERQMGVLGRLL